MDYINFISILVYIRKTEIPKNIFMFEAELSTLAQQCYSQDIQSHLY